MKNEICVIAGRHQQPLTFDLLPQAVSQLFEKLDSIQRLLEQRGSKNNVEQDEVFIINQAADFLHLSLPTIYALVSNRKIPFMKKGKRLYFSKKALTEWLLKTEREAI